MVPRRIVDNFVTGDGREVVLYQRGDAFTIQVDEEELMSSRAYGSERDLARLALAELGDVPSPRVLVGGLGMGFTLRSVLDSLGDASRGRVTVAELFPTVVAWNGTHLAHLAARPLDDPRVTVAGDVARSIDGGEGAWDVVLLDVDNGPDAFTVDDNRHLYGLRGILRLHRALAPGGVLAVWSAQDDPGFARRLHDGGFDVRTHRSAARVSGKGGCHFIFVGRKNGRGPSQSGRSSKTRSK